MIKYQEMSNDEVYDYLASHEGLVGGSNPQLRYIDFATIDYSVFNLAAFDSSSGEDVLVGLAALEDMRRSGWDRGLNVKYISVVPSYQKKGIGKKLAKGLAEFTKSQKDCLTRHPTSEGGSALTPFWKELSKELDLEIFMTFGSGKYFFVNEDDSKIKLYTSARDPQSINFLEEGQEVKAKFISVESLGDFTSMVRVWVNGQEVLKPLSGITVIW